MVRIFRHQHLGDRCLGRQAAFDQPSRRRRLHHEILAGPTGVFGSAHDQNSELRRHDVEPLGDIFPDSMQLAGATGADFACHIDQRFDTRQVRR
jgi:hypothetical protein